MRIFVFFILLSINVFSQDTTYFGKDFVVTQNSLIIEKNFRSSKKCIRIVYQYNSDGILIRRNWYNREGKLLSVSLDK
jgi:hypothetical protein